MLMKRSRLDLIAEVIVFLVMAFMVPPPEEPHWQRYFPNINEHPDLENPNFKPDATYSCFR